MKEKKEKSSNQIKNKSVSEELLVSVREALYKLKDYLNKIDFTDEEGDDSKKAISIITIIEKMGKAVETLQILESKVQKDEDVRGKSRGNNKLGMFEDSNI